MEQYADAWMETYTGKRIDYFNVRPEDITVEDIARGLSNTARFTGQTRFFYSVAQHSILMFHYAALEDRARALLHDAAEAYVCDIPRPLKHILGATYAAIEENFERAIAVRFGLEYPIKNAAIAELDNRILLDERKALMPNSAKGWAIDGLTPLGVHIEPWGSGAWGSLRSLLRQMEPSDA